MRGNFLLYGLLKKKLWSGNRSRIIWPEYSWSKKEVTTTFYLITKYINKLFGNWLFANKPTHLK